LRGGQPGQYALELVRSSEERGPVRGEVELLVGQSKRRVPFVLEGERVRFATAQIRMHSRLVPADLR
jgi:hypothetical protein